MSQALAAIGEANNKANANGSIERGLDVQLFVERKSLEWEYAQDPASENLYAIGNWVLALCGVYLFQAQQISGSGGSISPITPSEGSSGVFPIYITQSNFADATNYNDDRVVGQNIIIFLNEINRYLIPFVEFQLTVTGVDITLAGFDATAVGASYNLVIEKYTAGA